jgi:hypothetical protein
MCAEYKRVPGWKHWYDERKPTTEEARIFKGTTDVRNRTQKAGALRTVSKITVAGLSLPNGDNAQLKSIIDRARRDGIAAQISGSGSNYTLKLQVEGQPVILAARKVQMERELAEFPGQDILRICDQYYGMVSQLVTDCEKRFDA